MTSSPPETEQGPTAAASEPCRRHLLGRHLLGRHLPRRRRAAPDDEGGRGLPLVATAELDLAGKHR